MGTAVSIEIRRELEWKSRGACVGQDPALFFPEAGEVKKAAAAKAICAECPVQMECLMAGLTERYGIWGGLARKERLAWIKKNRRPEGDAQQLICSSPICDDKYWDDPLHHSNFCSTKCRKNAWSIQKRKERAGRRG